MGYNTWAKAIMTREEFLFIGNIFMRFIPRRSFQYIATLLTLAASVIGCNIPIGYMLSDGVGELLLLARAVPIEQALDDPSLTDEQRDKLALVIRARDYAQQVIGLNVGDSYRNFVNLGDESLAWNLSASKKDALEPYIWPVPVAGELPYFGFFLFDQAVAERDRLVALGYDTVIYEVDAFSTVGLLPDPVTSAMLKRDLISLADTVIHEMLHNTVFKPGFATFNESLATFVGRTGAIEFIQLEYGPDTLLTDQAAKTFEDTDLFNAFLQDLTERVSEVYNSDLGYDEKLAARKTIFEAANTRFPAEVLPLMNYPDNYETYTDFAYNNAFLLLNVRYNTDEEVYQGIYDMAGGDWYQTLTIFHQAAMSDDPVEYLRGLLGQ